MTDTLNDSEFRRYALLGAEARLLQIDKEAASIYQAFPELRKQAGAQGPRSALRMRRPVEGGGGAVCRPRSGKRFGSA